MSKTIWPWLKDSLSILLLSWLLARLSVWLMGVQDGREKVAVFAVFVMVTASLQVATRILSGGPPARS